MKCEKCGNDYISQSYFATPTICRECFDKLSEEEKRQAIEKAYAGYPLEQYSFRIGFGRRLAAYVLDGVFVYVIFAIAFFATGLYDQYKSYFVNVQDLLSLFTNPQMMREFTNAIMPISFIITFMYYSLEVVLAATPGKFILGIQIANQDRTYANVVTLFIRFFLKHSSTILSLAAFVTFINAFSIVSSLISVAFIIGCFFVLAQKRQGFHDMLAKTAVFRRHDLVEKNNIS
jgi:uncharacterized RDD family membrane protein YckC